MGLPARGGRTQDLRRILARARRRAGLAPDTRAGVLDRRLAQGGPAPERQYRRLPALGRPEETAGVRLGQRARRGAGLLQHRVPREVSAAVLRPVPDGRPDPARRVLTFTSPPLQAEFEIAGPIKLVLYAASTQKDTDFIVKLSQQYAQSAEERSKDINPRYQIVTKRSEEH